MKKLFVLMKKDIYNALTEKTSLLMISVSVCFCPILYYLVGADMMKNAGIYIASMFSFFNLAILPMSVFPLIIAEEKENQTLAVLKRSGIGDGLFLLSKALTVIVLELLCSAVIFFFCGPERSWFPIYQVFNFLITAALLPVGGIVALYAKDKNSANVYATFGVLFMMCVPVFSIEMERLGVFSKVLPTTLLTSVFYPMVSGVTVGPSEIVLSVVVWSLWSAAGYIAWIVIYKKKGGIQISNSVN